MDGIGDRQRTAGAPAHLAHPAPPRPGALTQLLADLVKAPEGAGWEVPLQPGDVVGKFEVVREIGRGGFGVVYQAHDRELSRSVAFKAVRAGTTATAGTRAVAEAEAAARLAHPNIVHLYDLGHGERGAWLIMELLRGRSLAERLADGPLPLREAVRVAVEISRGLAHAHQQGVIHRDLKPSNVFLCDDGQVKVLDFGLAQVFGKAGLAGGTPAYMAPEQARGEPGDERTDVYSLGLVFRELIHASTRGAPAALTRLLARMTAADPAERPASGAEVLAALLPVQRSLEPKRLLWAAAFLVAIAFGSALAFAWFWQRPLPPGPLLTALADTDNQTGDADLDGLSELLRTGLEQSKRLSVMARSRLLNVLREAGASSPRSIGEADARSVARRAVASLLLVPAVRRLGDGFGVEVRAIDVARSQPLFTVRETAGGKGSVLDALDRTLAAVRSRLGEPERPAGAPSLALAQSMPPDPAAWRLYADGRQFESQGMTTDAEAAFRKAIEIDPDFALAHVRLLEPTWFSDRDENRRHAESAMRNLHRVSPKDRLLIEATEGSASPSTDQLLALLDRVIAGWPEDPDAYILAADYLLTFASDAAAARPYLEKALELGAVRRWKAMEYLMALDRLDNALAVVRRWTTEEPSELSFIALSKVHHRRGERREALDAARGAVSLGAKPWGSDLIFAYLEADRVGEVEAAFPRARAPPSHWLILRGRWKEALVAFDRDSPPADAPVTNRGVRHLVRAKLVASLTGDPQAVWKEVLAQLETGFPVSANAWILASLGDVERAQRVMDAGLGDFDRRQTPYRKFQAMRRWKQGDREGALRLLGEIDESDFNRGQILVELGRDREAVEAFGRARRVSPYSGNYVKGLLYEAAALERLGERDQARQVLGRLQRLWNRPDPDLPLVAQMRALERKLASGGK